MRLFSPGKRYVDECDILHDNLLTFSVIEIVVSIPSTDVAVSLHESD